MTIDQVFTHIHNRDGFVQDIIVSLEDWVTLPSQVATVQELVKEVRGNGHGFCRQSSFLTAVAGSKSILVDSSRLG
jgi:hypothetical protein